MKPVASVVASAAVLAASFATAGCGEETAAPQPGAGAEAVTNALRASCTTSDRYVAVAPDATCADVPADRGGRWAGSTLFPDAPAVMGACVYVWSGSPAETGAQLDALRGALGPAAVVTPACGDEGASVPGAVEPIDHSGIPVFAGSAGCDVCGVVKKNEMWIVLPPSLVQARKFVVALTNGDASAFALHVAPDVRATSVTLPPPPAGTKYVEGRVTIF